MLEAAPQCGGRARGLRWPVNGRELAIDNGQHLMIGAYRETLALLAQANAPQWHKAPLQWCTVSHAGQIELDWKISNSAWPWRALMALLPGHQPMHRQRVWPLAWRRSLFSVVQSMQWLRSPNGKGKKSAENLTAKAWLESLHVPQLLIAGFWKPLTEGALNTEFETACAGVLANVIHDSLCGPAWATTVMTPPSNLSIDGVDPIVRWLLEQKVAVLTGYRVNEVHAEPNRLNDRHANPSFTLSVTRGGQPQRLQFDQVVIALPFHATLELWQGSGLPQTDAIARLMDLHSRAITTAWVVLDEEQERKMAHLPSWFVLHPDDDGPQFAQVVVRRPGVIAAVTSARLLQMNLPDQASLAVLLAQQLQRALNIDIRNCPQKWITEKMATWAATPQTRWANPSQAQGLTGVNGLWRCADDLEPGYPATIESAVRSGARTAQALLTQSSNRH